MRKIQTVREDMLLFVDELTAGMDPSARTEARKTVNAIFFGSQEAGELPPHEEVAKALAPKLIPSRRRGRI